MEHMRHQQVAGRGGGRGGRGGRGLARYQDPYERLLPPGQVGMVRTVEALRMVDAVLLRACCLQGRCRVLAGFLAQPAFPAGLHLPTVPRCSCWGSWPCADSALRTWTRCGRPTSWHGRRRSR